MCSQPLPPSLSPPSANLMIMALEEYGYQSRRGIRVPKKWRSSYSGNAIFKKKGDEAATAVIVSAVCQANDHGFGGIRVPKQKRNTGTKEMEVFLFRDKESIRDPESINF
nr:hypothetical protein [Tanacetum cinerariifolium]